MSSLSIVADSMTLISSEKIHSQHTSHHITTERQCFDDDIYVAMTTRRNRQNHTDGAAVTSYQAVLGYMYAAYCLTAYNSLSQVSRISASSALHATHGSNVLQCCLIACITLTNSLPRVFIASLT